MTASSIKLFPLLLFLLLVACGQHSTDEGSSRAPAASFTATPESGPAPLEVTFDASDSSNLDGTIQSYRWDFGDGSTGEGRTLDHTFEVGEWIVTLRVTDGQGAQGVTTRKVSVHSADDRGTVTGSIRVAETETTGVPGNFDAPFVPGEVIVGFKPGLRTQSQTTLQIGGAILTRVRPLSLPSTNLYQQRGADREATLALVQRLEARDDVLYAHPNYLLRALRTPDDAHYSYQWHLPAINLPNAWDTTTGSSSVVVAVVDSGILWRERDASSTHPDFSGRVLPGYDFVSSELSNDGDGRDADPFDPGDSLNGTSSFHGSHVAGTVAAASDNGKGIAGVDWQAKILPVRALGLDGSGSVADIIDGVLWASGLSVTGVPRNLNPADVINLSLGGEGSCSYAMQNAFDQVRNRSAVVVVAAGNDSVDVSSFVPASCRGVVTVGATDLRGYRAHYSNYGSHIDLMAPGGDASVDRNGDGYGDGVLSLGFDEERDEFGYSFYEGTSMAAPHVAGVVALLRSLEPSLTPDRALHILQETAKPLTTTQCGRAHSSDCGAGLIDAAAALSALQSTPETPEETPFSPDPLDFGRNAETLELTLHNPTASERSWTYLGYHETAGNPSDLPDDGVVNLPDDTSGNVPAGLTTGTKLSDTAPAGTWLRKAQQ